MIKFYEKAKDPVWHTENSKTDKPMIQFIPELIKGFGRRSRRSKRRVVVEGEVGGEKAVPKRVFGGEAVEAAAGDGDAAEVLVAEAATFDSDFEDSPPQFVGEEGHFRESNKEVVGVSESLALTSPGKLCLNYIVLYCIVLLQITFP